MSCLYLGEIRKCNFCTEGALGSDSLYLGKFGGVVVVLMGNSAGSFLYFGNNWMCNFGT